MLQPSASMLTHSRFNQSFNEPSADAIFLIDPHGRVTFANSRAQKVFGLTAAELLGKPLHEAITLSRPEEPSPLRRRPGSKGSPPPGQTVEQAECFLRKDGSMVHGRWSQAPLELDGRHLGAVLVIHDLSEPAWGEQARHETQLRLTALLDSAMDGIVILDCEKRILMCNPAAEKMFGYTSGELVGSFLECLLPAGLPVGQDLAGQVADCSQTGVRSGAGFLSGARSNGEEFPVEASISEVEVRGRKFFTVTLRDITERKRAEQALAESQERLRQSQKMAVIGQLAGGVAHDFNNLLTVIGGHAELLLAGLPPQAPMRESLSQICNASSRAASLTRQLLAFSRKQVFEPRMVDLNHLIRDTEKMLRRLIGEDVALETLLAPDLSPVKVDPSQMDQVLLNLAVNARDAMPKGGRLTITTLNIEVNKRSSKGRSGVRPGSYVVLVVNDTGWGMTPEVRARIFEPFFTTKSIGKGTGLGLTVVHGIVKQSGGHIAVQSEPGAGTTFKIFIPAARGRSTRAPRLSHRTDARGCETVLLVEDEDTLRRLGSVVLESYGYTVLTAANGHEALTLAASGLQKLDLLLTDVVMPGISGCELANALRDRQPDLKVLFLSGYTEEAILHRGPLNDGAAFLHKPFSPASLAAKVRQVLDGDQAI